MDDGIFRRTQMLLGAEKLRRLSQCHVLLFGLGGVGSYAAETLARCGIGELTLVDADEVSLSNRNRQLYALESTTGLDKVEVARERIAEINPECRINTAKLFYLPENGDEFFKECGSIDYIADAIDTVSAKLDIACRARGMGVPLISCMGTGNKLDPTRLRVTDISDTRVCPLCRVMRRELRSRGINSLRVVWSDEEPLKPLMPLAELNDCGRRQTPGSVAFVPSVAGILMAREIVMNLTCDVIADE